MAKTLRLVLGDQLSESLASLADVDQNNDVIMLAEVQAEAKYVKHHKKKVALLFSAMRHFAKNLKLAGYQVRYSKIDDADNTQSLHKEVERALADTGCDAIVLTHPGEYRVLKNMQGWQTAFGVPVEIRDDDRFLCTPDGFADWAKDRKQLRMEYFYREMRKSYGILMDGDKPIGGKWNYDAQNRKTLPDDIKPPAPSGFAPDNITQSVLDLVRERFNDHFGSLDNFQFAVTREQALEVLDDFIEQRLPNFGDYQDAMVEGQPWLYHSHLSFYLNCGLLVPKEVLQAAEAAYHSGQAPLNAVEGFIRQILGWREYVRGLYWLKMPEYRSGNALDAQRQLPSFFWNTDTHMNCLRQCIQETHDNAYAHHIQRLMVLGNFLLLIGAHPDDVNEWYLLVYADAYEWVELPNVTGMILFADGGVVASKPYAAGGSYINKMSNYCQNCRYKVTQKTGERACPFNYLYWDFLDRHQQRFGDNPRLSMIYSTWNKMAEDKRQATRESASNFLKALDDGEKV